MTVLRELKPTRFNYKVDKEEEHVGFIAEEVPELLANKDRKGLQSDGHCSGAHEGSSRTTEEDTGVGGQTQRGAITALPQQALTGHAPR